MCCDEEILRAGDSKTVLFLYLLVAYLLSPSEMSYPKHCYYIATMNCHILHHGHGRTASFDMRPIPCIHNQCTLHMTRKYICRLNDQSWLSHLTNTIPLFAFPTARTRYTMLLRAGLRSDSRLGIFSEMIGSPIYSPTRGKLGQTRSAS